MKLVGLLLLVVLGGAGWAYLTILESDPPLITTQTQPAFVGTDYVQTVEISDANRGVQRVRVVVVGGEKEHVLAEETYEGGLFSGATIKAPRRIEVRIQPKELKLPDGQATLAIEAVDFSLRGNRASAEVPLRIDTRPPLVQVRTGLTYVNQGGAELAVYSFDEEADRQGVQVGDKFYPGFPHPTQKNVWAALYAMPWKDGDPSVAKVVVRDRAGNERAVELTTRLLDKPVKADKLELSEQFLQNKVSELGGDTSDLLASYVKINNEMREQNAQTLRELCASSSRERLWSGPFIQMGNSKVGASFADQRTYLYQGKEIDHQVHLGYDLASTSRAPIPASNDGVVAFAGPLGIYGQTVVIDHGLGLFSLYGHLSEISVEKGRPIAKGEFIGKTGTTGLAGGDHLHFGILVSGEFVNPKEWFDPKWIKEHLEVKLAPEEPAPAAGEAGLPAAPAEDQ